MKITYVDCVKRLHFSDEQSVIFFIKLRNTNIMMYAVTIFTDNLSKG